MSFKTIRSQLCATEETRKYLWHWFLVYTLLINQLLEQLPKEPEFDKWREKGKIPRTAIVALCNKLLAEEVNLKGLPARFNTSAVLLVGYTFASIFAIQTGLRLKCEGKQRWLSVAEQDLELAQSTHFGPEAIRETAAQVLVEVEVERQREFNAREDQTGQPLPVMSVLFQFWDKAAKKPLRRRSIAHLLRNDCKVNPEAEDPDELALRLSKKRIQIERLQEQLNSRLPIGRDPTGKRSDRYLQEAIAVAQCPEEFDAWERSLSQRMANLSTQFNTLPYPLLFASCDDLYWSWEPEQQPNQKAEPNSAHTLASIDPAPVKPKPRRTRMRQRKKQARPRIAVRLKGKGLSHLPLRLYCDRRQLPLFRQLVSDWEANKARKQPDKFSLALFALRSASLMWVKDPLPGSAPQLPWQTHRLYLHATIDPRLLSAEGTEAVRQEKIDLMGKYLQGLEKADEIQDEISDDEQAELLVAKKNRASATKRNQTTLTRLQNNSPPSRPSRMTYQGNPQIAVKVAFSREHVMGVAVCDGFQPVIDYRDVEALMIDPRVALMEQRSHKLQNQPERLRKATLAIPKSKASKSKHPRYKPKISARQLQLQPCRLLKRWRRLKHKNAAARQAEQRHDLYRPSQSESNLAHYINHLLAKGIVELCQRWSAGCIILPEFGDLRESIESEIQSKAKQKYPDDDVERQKQYAKEFRMEFHQWNYKDLSQCIRSRAAKVGIPCKSGKQPRLGTLRDKAIGVVALPPKPKKNGGQAVS